jgi:hypothetical protein
MRRKSSRVVFVFYLNFFRLCDCRERSGVSKKFIRPVGWKSWAWIWKSVQMRANEGARLQSESAGAEYRLQGMDAFLSYFRVVWRALCGADRWGACLQPSPARRRHRSLVARVLRSPAAPANPSGGVHIFWFCRPARLCFPSAPLRPPAIFPPPQGVPP